jgi:hypothetical protein
VLADGAPDVLTAAFAGALFVTSPVVVIAAAGGTALPTAVRDLLRMEELPRHGSPDAHPAADDGEDAGTGDDLLPVALPAWARVRT